MSGIDAYLNRIVCGDSLEVLKAMPDRSVDLIVTDPPYGDNVGYGTAKTRIAGNEHPLVALMAMSQAYRVLKRHSAAYMFCGVRHLGFILSFFNAYTRYRIRDLLIWDKVSMGVGHGFRKQYECILVLEKGRPRYHNKRMLNILSVPRTRLAAHPHAKPLKLIQELISHSSDEGDVVLDPFLGSGVTSVAAQSLRRKYIGIEIDPAYCRLAESKL